VAGGSIGHVGKAVHVVGSSVRRPHSDRHVPSSDLAAGVHCQRARPGEGNRVLLRAAMKGETTVCMTFAQAPSRPGTDTAMDGSVCRAVLRGGSGACSTCLGRCGKDRAGTAMLGALKKIQREHEAGAAGCLSAHPLPGRCRERSHGAWRRADQENVSGSPETRRVDAHRLPDRTCAVLQAG
jgi:hypothetical protein